MDKPLVQINDFSWRYESGDWVLLKLNLVIYPGERVGIIGQSGSGKSTLALALNGLIPQSYAGVMSGQVVVAGFDTATTTVCDMAHQVAMVFQSPDDQLTQVLVCHEIASGIANLQLPLEEIQKRVKTVAEQLGLTSLLFREVRTLSGGEKQKVALATALAMHPQLLVLDEPTTDLDPRAKKELIALLKEVDPNMAMVVVSHDLETILPLVNRLVVIRDRTIITDGPVSNVLSQPELLRESGIALSQVVEFNELMKKHDASWPILASRTEVLQRLSLNGHFPQVELPWKQQGISLIELQEVSFCYPQAEQYAIDGINLTVNQGEIIAILGENGCGKTTLSKLILGLLKPLTGQIKVMGQLVTHIMSDRIGYIFQNPDVMLSQLSVVDEVGFSFKIHGHVDPEAVNRIMETFNLKLLATRFPLSLSKGQRQRLAYASIVGVNPPILIFDEPTTGIDKPGIDQIMNYMDGLRKMGATIIFITHDVGLALQWADRIVVMHTGKLAFVGNPTELIDLSPEELHRNHIEPLPISRISKELRLNFWNGIHCHNPQALFDLVEGGVLCVT